MKHLKTVLGCQVFSKHELSKNPPQNDTIDSFDLNLKL